MASWRQKLLAWYGLSYLVCMAIYFYETRMPVYRNSEKAKAVIIDRLEGLRSRGGRYSSSSYSYPQFQFSYHDTLYTSADRLFWTRSKSVGQAVTVIFPKGSPDDAVIYTFISFWISLPALLIGLLIAVFIFAIFFFIPGGVERGY